VSLGWLLQAAQPGFAGQCKIQRLEAPVTMNGLHPTVTAEINGKDALFTINTGSWWSSITPAAAEQYQLKPQSNRTINETANNYSRTVGVTTVGTFTVFSTSFQKIEFIVGRNASETGAAGEIGLNFLHMSDVEFDLARGSVNFLKTKDCSNANLVYWGKPGDTYSVMSIERRHSDNPHIIGTAYLNGKRLRAWFNTAATASWVDSWIAEKAGVKPGDPGVEEINIGTQANPVRAWIGTFESFKIGDEEVHNARLHFRDLGGFDMTVGADFFLSHHVLVANSQSKLYFTYNGGPVFNYAKALALSKAATSEATNVGAETPATATASESNAKPTAAGAAGLAEAAELARRAAGYAARHDYEHALQDFNRACELAPNEAGYFYQRGLLQLNSNHMEAGTADIETALRLNPEYVDAYFVRADIRMRNHANAQSLQDLNAVNRLAAKEATIRLKLAEMYDRINERRAAIEQLDLWIAHHPGDLGLIEAYNSRCWDRAVLNENLNQALDDCNQAINRRRNSQALLDSRGFVNLRRKDYFNAIADYDAALKANPKAAFSLYSRGVAKSLAGKKQEGAKDIAAAIALDPEAVKAAKLVGIEAPGA